MPVSKDFLPLFGSSGGQGGTYEIDQSIRFNDGDSPYMARTFGTATNAKKWTMSGWAKIAGVTDGASGGVRFLDVGGSAGTDELLSIGSGYAGYEKIYFWSRTSSSYDWRLETTQLFRDPAAWYHLVFVYDSDNTLEKNRMILYVNGERITAFAQEVYPSSGEASRINTAVAHRIGASVYAGNHSNGYHAEMNFIDGQALTPASFGEFNNSNIWVPIQYTGSYGNNGFHVDGRDSSDLGDDESGNGNDFSTSGLASNDQRADTPTNNQITFNPLNNQRNGGTPSNGNLDYVGPGTRTLISLTANVPTTGKWVVAYKVAQISTNAGWQIGLSTANDDDFGDAAGSNEDLDIVRLQPSSSNIEVNDRINNSYITPSPTLPITTSDEFWVAVDMDSGNIFMGIYDESDSTMKFIAADGGHDGNPATGANPTLTASTAQMPRDNVVFSVCSKQTSQHIYLQRSTEVSGTTPTGYTYFENVKDLL